MTTFVNNDVASGNVIYASDHNEMGSRVAAVVNGNIEADNLASNAVTTAKIADSNVTTAKIADSNVTTAKILDSNVTTAKIADDAVTPAKWVNPYCFRAYDSGGTTLTDAAAVKINLATESYDYNNNFASSTYTVPVSGVYHFSAALISSPIATHVGASLRITKNSTTVFYGAASSDSTGYLATASGDVLCTAGDTIELYFFQNSAGNETSVTGSDSTWMSGHLVHAI